MSYAVKPSENAVSAISVTPQHRAWWKEASVYQIYPSSFKDSNNDGVGDLPGIISKVDYLKKLGVDVVWLSPILQSPQVDMGYDISNYEVIDTRYGHISDVDELIKRLHERGMKLLMDLVVNHTSDQHEWFKKSRSSKDNEYRNWYIWRKPVYDSQGNRHPPNNWAAAFQGSAWEYDEHTDEYYLHLFSPEQPDLNWEHPPVRDAVHKIIRFWLDRGADGFRMDVINFISKEPGLPDAPITNPNSPWQWASDYFAAGPRLHEYIQGIGSILKEYNAFSVGEMPCVKDPKEVIKSVRYDRGELNMIFHFDLVDIDHGSNGKFSPREWKLPELKDIVEKWQTFMYQNGGWNALYLENHDQPRSVTRFACDCPKHRQHSSTMLATFLGCQAGTVFVYQGQELGMINVPKDWKMEDYRDVECLNHWKLINSKSPSPAELAATLSEYQKKSRDNARTPMQWSSEPHGGFMSSPSSASSSSAAAAATATTTTTTEPWIPINPSYKTLNAASQTDDPNSPFTYWKSVLAARKRLRDVFVYGTFELLDRGDERIVAFLRRAVGGRRGEEEEEEEGDEGKGVESGEDGEKILVLCNFSKEMVSWRGEAVVKGGVKDVVLSNYGRTVESFRGGGKDMDKDGVEGIEIELGAYEACALLLQ